MQQIGSCVSQKNLQKQNQIFSIAFGPFRDENYQLKIQNDQNKFQDVSSGETDWGLLVKVGKGKRALKSNLTRDTLLQDKRPT